MYISRIQIKGFRNFRDTTVTFNDGVNVIIGHNNAGKSNLLRGLSLVLDNKSVRRLVIDDFCKYTTIEEFKLNPPKISIALTITQSKDEDLNSDDLVTVGSYLTKLEPPYEAQLTYEFYLPEKEIVNYQKAFERISDIKVAWQTLRQDFIRLYIYKIYGGIPDLKVSAENDGLQKFDYQFLDAIRDVERDMFTGRTTLLRDVLDFFMDYEIKNDKVKTEAEKEQDIKRRKDEFASKADGLIGELQARMAQGKKQILSYAKETGASFNRANPNFEGSISDVEIFSALKLIVEYETGIKIPATHNGLGYNNLIFMSLLLAKMQVNSNGGYLGSNAKVFPILAIEEPEAHLHPAMQYKFLKFLRENKEVKKKVRQIFVTTHSTQITSAVSLDEIICLHNSNESLTVGYPGRVFPGDDQGNKAKAYVQRFLDATKSDMLFAQKVILVEGLAEQILLSVMARYVGKSLEDNHIAVINIGGRYFNYFLFLFDGLKPNTIPKKIACITDRDPERKQKAETSYRKCYPFEYNQDITQYDYQDNATKNIEKYSAHANIRYFSQDILQGKTFEYDLILSNPDKELLITESAINQDEIKELMQNYKNNASIDELLLRLRESDENSRIKSSIALSSWGEEEKKKAIIAARYLNSVEKGENALKLAYTLEENMNCHDCCTLFRVPKYIKDAIEWLCQ